MTYATAWHCDYVGDVTPTGMDCAVTATSTSEDGGYIPTGDATTTDGQYNGANFHEWLFVGCVILFFVALRAWPSIFSKPSGV